MIIIINNNYINNNHCDFKQKSEYMWPSVYQNTVWPNFIMLKFLGWFDVPNWHALGMVQVKIKFSKIFWKISRENKYIFIIV